MRRRRRFMDRPHDGAKILRAGDPTKVRKFFQNRCGLRAHAAGDDDLAVFRCRRADRGKQFGLGAVEKTAGIDDDRRRAPMRLGEFVTFRAELPDDPLAIDKGLGAAKRDEGNFWRLRGARKAAACCHWRTGLIEHHAFAWHARRRLASGRLPNKNPAIRMDRAGFALRQEKIAPASATATAEAKRMRRNMVSPPSG